MERREPNTKARGRVVAVALAASLVPVMGGGADGLWAPQLHGQGDTHEAMSALVAQADPQQQIGDDLYDDATYEGDVTVTSPLSLNGHTLTVTGSLVARADVDLGGGTKVA